MVNTSSPAFLSRENLQTLIDCLIKNGYEVIGPTIHQHAIVYRSIENVGDLPRGWTDHQEPAVYRLHEDEGGRLFEFNCSQDSWKRFFFPASAEIGTATLTDQGWEFEIPDTPIPRLALLGVRACDLAAISVQDRVFRDNMYVDTAYRRRRESALIIAVNCSTAASTCFCSSMGTGPQCEQGFDIVMTEIDDGFVIETGSSQGAEILTQLSTIDVTVTQLEDAAFSRQRARDGITKQFDHSDVHDLLLDNLEHAHWSAVAERCLSCTNCTMVCPTCFCSNVIEVANVSNTEVSRVRQWDSCFDVDFSRTASGIVRDDIRSRYRQWLTHKLATWQDQFDVSGCVGCGRCITWCPVGIDLTEEVAALRACAS
jgi:ferredoxin